jgi:hypothetical protein
VALVGKIARGPRSGERPNPEVVIQKVVVKREAPAKRKSADK